MASSVPHPRNTLVPPVITVVTPEPDHQDDQNWRHMTRTLAHYTKLEQIGEGTYGQVYRAICKDSQRVVALKKMRIHHGNYWGMPLQLIREIKILKRLTHPNLLTMIEVVTSKGVEHLDNNDNDFDPKADVRERYKGNLFLVLEYMTHDLTGLMDVAYQFTEVQIKSIMKQLLEAIAYMHEQKYVHRDIKSSNILLDNKFCLKLADFGLARSLEPPILDQMHDRASSLELTNKVITLWYRPPEILVGATLYGGAVDVWSAGCILAELMLGKPLFAGKTELEQLSLILDMLGTPSPDTWDYLATLKRMRSGEMVIDRSDPKPSRLRDKYGNKMPSTALNLLEKLLEWDPRKRLTAANALQQRYFWAQPVPPENPADLGPIQLASEGGHFHEFQTKKKRREAKAVAEKAREAAILNGATEDEAKEEMDLVYRSIMKKVMEEGLAVPIGFDEKVGPESTGDVPKSKDSSRGKKKREHREDDEKPRREHEERKKKRPKEDKEQRRRESSYSSRSSQQGASRVPSIESVREKSEPASLKADVAEADNVKIGDSESAKVKIDEGRAAKVQSEEDVLISNTTREDAHNPLSRTDRSGDPQRARSPDHKKHSSKAKKKRKDRREHHPGRRSDEKESKREPRDHRPKQRESERPGGDQHSRGRGPVERPSREREPAVNWRPRQGGPSGDGGSREVEPRGDWRPREGNDRMMDTRLMNRPVDRPGMDRPLDARRDDLGRRDRPLGEPRNDRRHDDRPRDRWIDDRSRDERAPGRGHYGPPPSSRGPPLQRPPPMMADVPPDHGHYGRHPDDRREDRRERESYGREPPREERRGGGFRENRPGPQHGARR